MLSPAPPSPVVASVAPTGQVGSKKSSFFDWVKSAATTLVDPQKQQRLDLLTKVVQSALHQQRNEFSLRTTVAPYEHSDADLTVVKERIFRDALAKGWNDGLLTESKQKVANWLSDRLEIAPQTAQTIKLDFARQYFAAALAKSMSDGVLDAAEETHLRNIAATVGADIKDFTREFFRNEGDAILRTAFFNCTADGVFSPADWNYLSSTAYRLGITYQDLLSAVRPHAQQFIEHVLADSKSDGEITSAEESVLEWLLQTFAPDVHFVNYVRHEIYFLKTLSEIEHGKLPSIKTPSGVEIRSGEIAHFHAPAVWRQTKNLKSGPRVEDHHGTITLTDNRIIFASRSKGMILNYRRVVFHRGGTSGIEVQVDGKPSVTFFFNEPFPFAYPILRTAIALANQTLLVPQEGLPSRHIPRDVRQRVWQRYGGRCAECNDNSYLEFDHIIPFSRGGNNSDNNVQLLCRRCNAKKSNNL